MKDCCRCGRTLEDTAFYIRRATGRPYGACKRCLREVQNSYFQRQYRRAYEARPERVARKREYYRSYDVRVRRLWHGAKNRARRMGWPFDLTMADIVIPETCPILGVRLEFSAEGGPRGNSPSLDRLRPEAGYVRGNVRVISMRANQLKNNATEAELEAILRYMRSA